MKEETSKLVSQKYKVLEETTVNNYMAKIGKSRRN